MFSNRMCTLENELCMPSLEIINWDLSQGSIDERIDVVSLAYTASICKLPSQNMLSNGKSILELRPCNDACSADDRNSTQADSTSSYTKRPKSASLRKSFTPRKVNISWEEARRTRSISREPIHSVHRSQSPYKQPESKTAPCARISFKRSADNKEEMMTPVLQAKIGSSKTHRVMSMAARNSILINEEGTFLPSIIKNKLTTQRGKINYANAWRQ